MLFYILVTILILFIAKVYVKLNIGWNRSYTCLLGKTTIITGANSGIGFYTALDFAKRGAKVILACRDKHRAEEAKRKIIEATNNTNVHVRLVDFSLLRSVREFAECINKEEDRLDILVNNAGMGSYQKETTEDGLNSSMQVNHFAPFLLTLLLIDLLKKSKPSRIVNVSSSIAHYATVDVKNLNYFSTKLIAQLTLSNYATTKLCNVLFTNELARRLSGTGVTANSLHPGSVVTNFGRGVHKGTRILLSWITLFAKTAEEGAQTSIHVAVSKDLKYITGEYFDNCKISKMPVNAQDVKLALKLWNESEKFVKLTKEEKVL